jgi:hypothetical protein
MKFSTRQDIEAPADYVFARITDFDSLERQGMRRGVTVSRKVTAAGAPGPAWELKVPFRGKMRDLDARITQCDAPNLLSAFAQSGGLTMEIVVELVPLSKTRTRLTLGHDVRPKTLSARILVQSVKFAKNSLQKRFEGRVSRFCEDLGEAYAAQR